MCVCFCIDPARVDDDSDSDTDTLMKSHSIFSSQLSESVVCSLTHLRTRSLTHSLTPAFTHSLLLTHPFTPSYSFIHSRPLTDSPTFRLASLIHSPSLALSLVLDSFHHAFTHSLIHSLSLTHSLILPAPLVHSCLNCWSCTW